MHHILFILFIFIFSGTSAYSQGHETLESCNFPPLIPKLRISEPLDFCGESVELDKPEDLERMEKELLVTLWNRPQTILWLKRSGRYMALIEDMLKKENMPEDLKYIAIVESDLRPHAGSPKGAMGFWQFMKATGQKYGLKINPEKDERRNIFRSTEAAIQYLKELYDMLGSWSLSAAAYNMGEQGLQAEILAQNCKNYYDLYLPLETQQYVFRILSVKLILSNPEKYGFRFTKEDLYLPLQFDRVKIECFRETPILLIAQAAQTRYKVIKELNPEIRGHYIAAGIHSILIPKGETEDFHSRLKTIVEKWMVTKQERVYTVRMGDNLTTISERFDVPLPALMIWNRLGKSTVIHPGDRLVIYSAEDEKK